MLKLIHTSDWHLGATLHDAPRQEEHARFLTWLTDTIEAEHIDALVVAGDVFDRRQPSNEALAQYYRFLVGLTRTRLARVIVVGGNHDSPSQLDAPREVLAALDVTVVGGWEEGDLDRHLVALPNPDGQVEAVVLAVPYVHEWALGVRTTGLQSAELRTALTERFSDLYTRLCDRAEARYPGATLVATGHLTAVAADKGDVPREMPLLGTIEGLQASIFDPRLAYVALGHIHRPMPVPGTRARYSGSPIAIGPREARVDRRVVEVSVEGGSVQVRSLPVPRFRGLVALSGPLSEVQTSLATLTWDEPLPPYVSVEVLTDRHVPGTGKVLQQSLDRAGSPQTGRPELVHWRETNTGKGAPVEAAVRLGELSIEEVFQRLCAQRGEPVDEPLLGALREAIEASGVDA